MVSCSAVLAKIRGAEKKEESKTQIEGERLQYDASGMEQNILKSNYRVKLPEKEDDDLSEVDVEAEAEAEINERMKIKVEAQLRYDRMAKNKIKKGKGGVQKKK